LAGHFGDELIIIIIAVFLMKQKNTLKMLILTKFSLIFSAVMNTEKLTSALVVDYVKRRTSRDILIHFEAGTPLNGTSLEQIYESYNKSSSSRDSDPVSGVTSTFVFEYLWRSGFKTVALELQNNLGSEVNVNILQGLKIENLYHYFKSEQKLKVSKAIVKKSTNNRSYLDFVPICEAFQQQIQDWQPTNSELDRAVSYVLKLNSPIRYVSIQVSRKTLNNKKNRLPYPELVLGKFSAYQDGDKDRITTKWKCLTDEAAITNSFHLAWQLFESENGDSKNWKSLIVGSFLSMDLEVVRHAGDVIDYAIKLFCRSGKFQKEDDDMILDYVKQSGNNPIKWTNLATLMKIHPESLSNHFWSLKEKLPGGTWSREEELTLIDCLFPNDPDKNIEYIQSLNVQKMKSLGLKDILQRRVHDIWLHWTAIVCPILVRYHHGLVLKPWKEDLFCYIIEKNMKTIHEFDQASLDLIAPGISVRCVGQEMNRCRRLSSQRLPLHEMAKLGMEKAKNSKLNVKRIQAVIDHYAKGTEPVVQQL
jgi:hypothetical protein